MLRVWVRFHVFLIDGDDPLHEGDVSSDAK